MSETTSTGAKAPSKTILRGAKAPLFHGAADFRISSFLLLQSYFCVLTSALGLDPLQRWIPDELMDLQSQPGRQIVR